MKLNVSANLTGMTLVVLITLVTASVAVVTIDDLSMALNMRLLSKELDAYQGRIRDSVQILDDNGLAGVREYVDRAKSDILSDFRHQAGTMFGDLIILSDTGSLVLHPDWPVGTQFDAPCVQELWLHGTGQSECAVDGRSRIGRYATIPAWGWLLYVSVDTERMVQTRNEFLVKVGIAFLAVSFLGWLLLVRAASLVVRPLQKLSQAAEAISLGHWDAIPPPLARTDELGDLSRNFAVMAERLHGAQLDLLFQADTLRQSKEKLEAEVAERIRIEKDLRKATIAFSEILDSMPSLVIGVDRDCLVTHWNKSAVLTTGIAAEKVIGLPLQDALPRLTGMIESVYRSMLDQTPIRLDRVTHTSESELRQEDILIFPLVSDTAYGAVIRLDDVTERVRMEELLIQSEKMTSLGGLAAGMAHEMNSPLAGIGMQVFNIRNRIFGEMAKNEETARLCGTALSAIQDYITTREITKMLDSIEEAGVRASKIMSNILQFSRRSEKQFSSHRIDELLEQTLELAANDYDLKKWCRFDRIRIVREFQPDLPLVLCEGSELQQVFLNLIKNGAQAMAGKDYVEAEPTFVLRLVTEEDALAIEIEDNGPGMDEAVRRRVFEPFFTTKAVGQGTGLGLSVSYFIITEQHHGRIEVLSVPGQWTRFVIHLPLDGPSPTPVRQA